MRLESKRLIIIPCTKEVLASTDYKAGPHIHMYIENLKKDPTLLGWGPWLIYEKDTYEVIGDIGFKGKPNEENTVEIGYGILPLAQSKGYATEAAQVIINFAFSFQQVEQVVAECLDDNYASIKVLEKLGMSRIGKKSNMLKWQLKKYC